MGLTSIEWTDNTWNPTRGCRRVSPECLHCYAERTAIRMRNTHYKGLVTITNGHPSWTGEVDLAPDSILKQPLHWKKPKRIFVDSMADLFYEEIPYEWIDIVFAVMLLCGWHTFLVLTKRSARMRDYMNDPKTPARITDVAHRFVPESAACFTVDHWPPPNVHCGVSAGTQKAADERIPDLQDTEAIVRFISYEPALEEIAWPDLSGIHWGIIGGESGPGARPFYIEWADLTIGQWRDQGMAIFMKQVGANPLLKYPRATSIFSWPQETEWLTAIEPKLKHPKGGDMNEWPERFRVREFPEIRA